MAQILNKSPFDEDVWNHTIPQMDFILEQYAKDNPDKLKFRRATDRQIVKENKSWSRVLHGDALLKWLGKFTNMTTITKLTERAEQDAIIQQQMTSPKKIVPRKPKPKAP